MITNRKNAGLAVVKDNLVFAVGGSTDVFHQLQPVDVLDLSSESPCWRSSVEMLVERNILGVGVINNYLYAFGGSVSSSRQLKAVECFDPNLDSWTSVAKMSVGHDGAGVRVLDSVLCAVGGYDGSTILSSVEA